MRNLLLFAAATILLAGCPPTDDPDAYAWYRRGSEDVLFCQNGGFSATFASGPVAGRWTEGPVAAQPSLVATVGSTSTPAFTLTERSGVTWGSAEIGEGWILNGVVDAQRAEIHARCAALD